MSFYNDRPLKPESQEDIKLAETTNGKRVLLERFARYDGLTCNVFNMAIHAGMSGEDKYVELAYHALLRAERVEAQLLRSLSLMPLTKVILPNVLVTAEELERLRRVDTAARAYVKHAGKPGSYTRTSYTDLCEALSPA